MNRELVILMVIIVVAIAVLLGVYFKENYVNTTYLQIGSDTINYPDFYNAALEKNTERK